jgi:hypothetical protein
MHYLIDSLTGHDIRHRDMSAIAAAECNRILAEQGQAECWIDEEDLDALESQGAAWEEEREGEEL